MRDGSKASTASLSQQQAIQSCRIHPTHDFIVFTRDEIEQSISKRFEHQVCRYPNRLAVKTKSCQLTYAALNHTANRLAHAILAQRDQEVEPIAVLSDHGAPVITGALGTLKAAKIYVPLEPSYPNARLTYMLEDLQVGLIVTDNKYLSRAKVLAQNTLQLLNLNELDPGLSAENPDISISPDTLAWILYTSGSTGQPKGVVQNHRNTLNEIRRHTNAFHICVDDRLTFLAPYSVIGGVREILLPLLNGATLHPLNLREEGLAKLATWLIQEEVTVSRFTTTVFRNFIGTLADEETIPRLRLIYVGGEPVTKRDIEQYKKHLSPESIFVNVFGSTETGIFRHYFIDKDRQITDNNVPVGYAVEDMEVLLLSESGQEVGCQQIGEIAVKGRFLSPGYWGRPGLTQATFLPDPDGGDDRIYRTGDLGCMQPGGCLVHLGRKDFQVKIRGHRVEVEEIERILLETNMVKEAVVMARQDPSGSKHLVAFLVPNGQPAPTVPTLRRVLAETLPDSMIPSAFVMLDAMPLTPNGKVDRQALSVPDQARPALESTFVAPRTPVEKVLTEIWAEVLGLEHVGIQDNFFELGGHSLLATQVMSRLRGAFQVELPLRSLFEAPTVANLAEHVMTVRWASQALQTPHQDTMDDREEGEL
jgi:amino acid adenylation domain-containing protein